LRHQSAAPRTASPAASEIRRGLPPRSYECRLRTGFRYQDDTHASAFELGAPVVQPVDGDGRIERRELPAGEYAVLVHVGPYRRDEVPDLRAARERLLLWAAHEGIEIAVEQAGGALTFAACIESYLTGRNEPDWTRWQTELAYLTS